MPQKQPVKSLQDVVEAVGVYPPEAYLFVQQGLSHTVEKLHGLEKEGEEDAEINRHVNGRDLCWGLRDIALLQWGLMARTVLAKWNVTTTMDFGKIVFALVEHDMLKKTDDDTVEDFRNVFDFRKELESNYKIDPAQMIDKPKKAERKS